MRATFATAEPYGAYHLAPLVAAFRQAGVDAVHATPDDSPLQGTAFPQAGADSAVATDVLVVTGGHVNAWTAGCAAAAGRAGVPVVFCELAYVSAHPPAVPHPPLTAVLAQCAASARDIATHLGPSSPYPQVVGTPLLDDLPRRGRVAPRSVVALTGVSAEQPDGGKTLRQACAHLERAGWSVTVRTHPREDTLLWDDWPLDTSPTAGHAAAAAQAVVGYPGTALVPAAAVGAPVVALATERWMTDRVPGHVVAVATLARSVARLTDVVRSVRPAPHDAVHAAAGPVGGAAARIAAVVRGAAGG